MITCTISEIRFLSRIHALISYCQFLTISHTKINVPHCQMQSNICHLSNIKVMYIMSCKYVENIDVTCTFSLMYIFSHTLCTLYVKCYLLDMNLRGNTKGKANDHRLRLSYYEALAMLTWVVVNKKTKINLFQYGFKCSVTKCQWFKR